MKKHRASILCVLLFISFFACAMEMDQKELSDEDCVIDEKNEPINKHNALLNVILKGIRDKDAENEEIKAIEHGLSAYEKRVGVEVAQRLKKTASRTAFQYLTLMSTLKPSERQIFEDKLIKLMSCDEPQWTDDEFKEMSEWVLWKDCGKCLTLDFYIDAYFRCTIFPTAKLQEVEFNQTSP